MALEEEFSAYDVEVIRRGVWEDRARNRASRRNGMRCLYES